MTSSQSEDSYYHVHFCSLLGVYFSNEHIIIKGFEVEYVSKDIPEVQHVNRDGLLPLIEIMSTRNGSRVDLLLCHRREVTQSKDFIKATSSFVLLSEKQVIQTYSICFIDTPLRCFAIFNKGIFCDFLVASLEDSSVEVNSFI